MYGVTWRVDAWPPPNALPFSGALHRLLSKTRDLARGLARVLLDLAQRDGRATTRCASSARLSRPQRDATAFLLYLMID
jgi:hypothetical protein